MEFPYKEVYFCDYCETCEHFKQVFTDKEEDICNDCLNNPANVYSHKPLRYKRKETKDA